MTLDLNHFKQKLEEEKATLEKDLGKIGRRDPRRPEEWELKPTGESDLEFHDDLPNQMEEMDEREETELSLENRYENIVRALGKIEKGTYGLCEISGEPIELDRLEANPAARTCKAHLAEGDKLS